MMARIVSGDDSALAAVFDQFSNVVFGLAARMIGRDQAGDVCQETFLALWDHPDRFDPNRGSLRAYLVTIARRRCIDHLRRSGRRRVNEERATELHSTVVPDIGESALAMIAGQRVRQALERLPAEQRQAIELAYFDGLTFRQVAVATNVSEGTAKSRIRLGLQRLGHHLRDHGAVMPT